VSHTVETCGEQLVESFTHRLAMALVSLDMYSVGSAPVQEGMRGLQAELAEVFAHGVSSPLRLDITGQQICHDGRALRQANLQAGRLLRLCHERAVTSILFEQGLDAHQLHRLLQLLRSRRDRGAFTPTLIRSALRNKGIRAAHFEVAAGTQIDNLPAALTDAPPHAAAIRQYQAMADVLQDNHVAAFRGDELELDAAAGVVEKAIAAMEEPSNLLTLAMNDDIDQFTVGHSVRVTLLALHVAQALGIPRIDLMRLGTAALLHDIGKSRIPQEILFKNGRLDADERTMMSMHSRWGGELLLEHGNIDQAAVGAAFCHHMGPQGQGYPERPLPFEPSGISCLVRVCDVFEALTSVRPYKPAVNPLHAYVIMNRMKGGFDERWLHFFIKSMGVYPIGTRLTLDHGEEAVVVANGPTLRQPKVALLTGPAGSELPDGAHAGITIGVETEGRTPHIHSVWGAGTSTELPHEAGPTGCCGC